MYGRVGRDVIAAAVAERCTAIRISEALRKQIAPVGRTEDPFLPARETRHAGRVDRVDRVKEVREDGDRGRGEVVLERENQQRLVGLNEGVREAYGERLDLGTAADGDRRRRD